ncbi:MAG: DUF1566 domain-containing protein [Rikenellaceae bacterium]|nr:DUF1566 domain-containing protein [Rikenellaceae bacterium]
MKNKIYLAIAAAVVLCACDKKDNDEYTDGPDNSVNGSNYTTLIIAQEDLPDKLTWAEAMGIDIEYNNALFNQPSYYTPTTTTGCGGYSEEGYPAGSWRLPKLSELQTIYSRRNSLDGLYGTSYSSSTESNETQARSLGFLTGQPIRGNKMAQTSVRCVRYE